MIEIVEAVIFALTGEAVKLVSIEMLCKIIIQLLQRLTMWE